MLPPCKNKLVKNIYDPTMAKNIYGPPMVRNNFESHYSQIQEIIDIFPHTLLCLIMSLLNGICIGALKNIYGPQMAKNIYGPQMRELDALLSLKNLGFIKLGFRWAK